MESSKQHLVFESRTSSVGQAFDQVKQVLSDELSADLGNTFLVDATAFWRNVQEPSTRVQDRALVAKLAILSLSKFNNRHIRAAATVNLLYRTMEPEWKGLIEYPQLLTIADAAQSVLLPESDFSDCRWYLSLILAKSAFLLFQGDKEGALTSLYSADLIRDTAYGFGQLFTNIVKATLFRIVISAAISYRDVDKQALRIAADYILQKASIAPHNYKFTNEWAYEEVAYVYTMMREIYNWRNLDDQAEKDISDLEQAGFRWRCVGAPFKTLI